MDATVSDRVKSHCMRDFTLVLVDSNALPRCGLAYGSLTVCHARCARVDGRACGAPVALLGESVAGRGTSAVHRSCTAAPPRLPLLLLPLCRPRHCRRRRSTDKMMSSSRCSRRPEIEPLPAALVDLGIALFGSNHSLQAILRATRRAARITLRNGACLWLASHQKDCLLYTSPSPRDS